jgi:thiamine-phosphate pyrophosphorylase
MSLDLTLYVITDRRLASGRSHEEVAREAIAGGATVIQLRDKEASTKELVEIGRRLRRLTAERGVTFIVNDRVDVALAVNADGVHLGQEDMPAALARQLMGPAKVIGVSASTVEEAKRAEKDGANYLGVGPVYATVTKPDAGEPIGVEGLAEILRAVSIPVVAIGGIKEGNVEEVIAAGADGVAVVSAVVAAQDIEAAARRLRRKIKEIQRILLRGLR